MPDIRSSWLPALLRTVEGAEPVAAVRVFAEQLADQVQASHVSFLIADFSGRLLIRLTQSTRQGPGEDAAEQLALSDEQLPYRTAITSQQTQVVAEADVVAEAEGEARREGRSTPDPDADPGPGGSRVRVLVPVSSRGEAMGLLEVVLPQAPDAGVHDVLDAAAHALALVVTAERRHTDLYEWGQRSWPVSLAAEIQRRLLPDAFTCQAGAFTLAAWLEPAGSVGGDTFDYSLDTDRLYLSMTDAMGHETDAALLATLAVGSLRNSRRAGAGLARMASAASAVIEEHRRGLGFVTGVLMSIDLGSGEVEVVNAGHPLPLLQRAGQVEAVPLLADFPFGVLPEAGYRVQHLQLQAGDRLVLLTDGMLERNAASLDLPALITECAGLHPRQLMQVLTAAVDEVAGGQLADDATALCLDWHP
ncbi:serine phosphatase RsbU (regulator of sigma subunit), partial [Kineococcus radiotolerans]